MVAHGGGFGGFGCSVSYCGGGVLVHQHGRALLRGPGVELRHCAGDAAIEVCYSNPPFFCSFYLFINYLLDVVGVHHPC